MTPTRRAGAVVATLTLVGMALTGCGTDDEATSEIQTTVIVVDTSGSVVEGTDLLEAAQDRVIELIDEITVPGGVVAVKALNDPNALCDDLVITLKAGDATNLDDERSNLKPDVPAAFEKYIQCAREHDTGDTQLFGLLAETAVSYPDAPTWDVYTDGIDNHDARGLGKGKKLRDPEFSATVIENLHPNLIPELSPETTITWHMIGRGTGLDAAELAGLREVFTLWTSKTGASAKVETN